MKDATKCQHLVCRVSSFKCQTTKYLSSKVLVSFKAVLAQRALNMAAYAEMEEAALSGSWQVHAYRGDATNQAAIRHEKVLAIAGATETHTCNMCLIRKT